MKGSRGLFTLVAAVMLSSCATQRFVLSENPVSSETNEAQVDKMQHFFVGGIGQTKTINVREVCKGKEVSHVETQLSFFDGLLRGLSYGIYTPRTAKVYCKN